MHTSHFIVNLFMSKVYNELFFKKSECFTFVFVDLHYRLCSTVQIFPRSGLRPCDDNCYKCAHEYFIHVIYLIILPTETICSVWYK